MLDVDEVTQIRHRHVNKDQHAETETLLSNATHLIMHVFMQVSIYVVPCISRCVSRHISQYVS